MKTILQTVCILLLLCVLLPTYSQEPDAQPQRTAEQEAVRQTERIQQELNLSPDQSRLVYEINLKYERERQISNTRAQALERIKNKNIDYQKVLTEQQFNRLQDKRFERNTVQSGGTTRPVENRIPTEYRSRSSVGVMPTNIIMRSNNRSSANAVGSYSTPQTVRRGTTTPNRNTPTSSAVGGNRPQAVQSANRTQNTSGSSNTSTSPTEGTTGTRSTATPSKNGRR